ncbi:9690_t:CDS:2 [Gigaspora margarita]|uniref:9690_t:CDS:1 n=1 Tax=Gigaspora margarita TaxID=4874 RepID=A0ABM8W1N7_GIGMA|nr:9690_t:CDS:2 [Gigaspora margarita]
MKKKFSKQVRQFSTRGRPKLASYHNNSKRNLQPTHDESTKRRC